MIAINKIGLVSRYGSQSEKGPSHRLKKLQGTTVVYIRVTIYYFLMFFYLMLFLNFRLFISFFISTKSSRVYFMFLICGALRDLVAFVQFKKREKLPWRNVNFSKVAGFSLQLY